MIRSLPVLLRRARLPGPTLFPYTTLFRSSIGAGPVAPEDEAAGKPDGTIDESGTATALAIDIPWDDSPSRRQNPLGPLLDRDRKSTRLNSSHRCISYAVFCLKKKKVHVL